MKQNLQILKVNEVLPINFTIRAFILLILALLVPAEVLIIGLVEVEDDLVALGSHVEEAFLEGFTVLELPFEEALEVVAFRNKDLAKHLAEVDNIPDLVVASYKEGVDSNHRIIARSNPQEVVDNNSLEDMHQLEEDAYNLGQ